MKKLTVLSLGWGVQSWTLAAMSALGDLPKIDIAIHSDTTWEHQYTYDFAAEWGPWLEDRGIRYVCVDDKSQAKKIVSDTGKDNQPVFIPVFTNGQKNDGQLRRQCTQRWKVKPMRGWLSDELTRLGLKKSPGIINQWLGISTDEFMRAKDSDVKYINHIYPLLDKKMSRNDCFNWLKDKGLPSPGKSACVFCPYKNRAKWQELKRMGGADWETAVTVDEAIRNKRNNIPVFVHRNRVPLAQAVDIPEDHGASQLDMFADFDLEDAECDSGYCFL